MCERWKEEERRGSERRDKNREIRGWGKLKIISNKYSMKTKSKPKRNRKGGRKNREGV